jgi:hypothetical protein
MKFLNNAEFGYNINNAKHWVDVTISTDPNTLLTEGIYRITAGGTAHANQPYGSAGSIIIVSTNNASTPPPLVNQVAMNGYYMYTRVATWMGSSYLWGSWVQCANAPLALTASSTTSNNSSGHTHAISGFVKTGDVFSGCGSKNISGTSLINIATASISVVAGTAVQFDLFGIVQNSTGAAQTLTFAIELGTLGVNVSGSTTVATGTATAVHISGWIGVPSTSAALGSAVGSFNPVSSPNSAVTGVLRQTYNSTNSNLTGTQTIRLRARGSTTASGLTLNIAGYTMEKSGGTIIS